MAFAHVQTGRDAYGILASGNTGKCAASHKGQGQGTRGSPFIVLAILVLCEEVPALALAEDIVVRFALDVRINDDHQLAACDGQLVLHVDGSREVVLVPCEIPAALRMTFGQFVNHAGPKQTLQLLCDPWPSRYYNGLFAVHGQARHLQDLGMHMCVVLQLPASNQLVTPDEV